MTLGRGSGMIFKLVGGARSPPLENYLPPNSNFSSDIGHFILKMPMSKIASSIFLKCIYLSKLGGVSPPVSKLEGRLPLLPPVPGPMTLGDK